MITKGSIDADGSGDARLCLWRHGEWIVGEATVVIDSSSRRRLQNRCLGLGFCMDACSVEVAHR